MKWSIKKIISQCCFPYTARCLLRRELHETAVLSKCQSQHGGPLSGIRVLDLTRVLAGPFATMLLADLGAEVIKVEKPGEGDDTRSWGPPFIGTESTYFLSINRNKKLSKKSDVLIENYLPGKLKRLGLGYECLQKDNPSLIYCSITGYGPGGPYEQRPGYDVIASAIGGLMSITGPENGEPCKSGVALTDLVTGLYAHGAIMAALMIRQKTGQGQKIDCSLLASQAFETKDGHLLIGAGNDGLFQKLCKVIDAPELAKDEHFLTNDKRVLNRKVLINLLENKFKSKTTKEWLELLMDSGIPYGPINDVEQVFDDPQVKYKELVQEISHPSLGKIQVPGPAVEYDGRTSFFPASSPPLLGQHTNEILHKILGYDKDKISLLHASNCVHSYKLEE